MKVTIADVAKKAGVSKSTVSRIINGNYEQNSKKTIESVLAVIKELDFRPNALAKGLKSNKTNVIGIVLSNLQNPFWANVLEGVEDTCRSNNFNLMICNSNEDPKLEEEHIRAFRMKQVDGIIINATLGNKDMYKEFVNEGFPFVTINRRIPELAIDSVIMDNVKGTKLAVEHLIQSGKKDIAFFVYPLKDISPRIERLEGYKEALLDNFIDVDKNLIRIVSEHKEAVKEEVRKLLNDRNVDAIFSTNNMMTLYILEELKELGLKVPEDISLIGYDETVWSMHLNPPLTTVYQPSYAMGESAANKLIELINAKAGEKPEPEIISLEPSLIIRESCGTKKGSGFIEQSRI